MPNRELHEPLATAKHDQIAFAIGSQALEASAWKDDDLAIAREERVCVLLARWNTADAPHESSEQRHVRNRIVNEPSKEILIVSRFVHSSERPKRFYEYEARVVIGDDQRLAHRDVLNAVDAQIEIASTHSVDQRKGF